jgi:WD40 repeat protein
MSDAKASEDSYDAFISYSTANSEFAARLQRWLERFATPWYRPRQLRIFRDFTSLSADHDLMRVIERGLARSRSFILLASPEAAASPWVHREVSWWRQHRSSEEFRIILTAGTLLWDHRTNDWDWTRTDAMPRAASGMFDAEPLWVDMSSWRVEGRLDRSNLKALTDVARIAAPLRGTDVDTLVGEHITQERRARRQRRGGVATLACLLVIAIVTSILAVANARRAQQQARAATARALAAAAVAATDSDQSLANLLAVEAYRMDPLPEALAALFHVNTANPALVRYFAAGATVSRVAASADGAVIVVGTADGRVLRWRTTGGPPEVLLRPGGQVTGLAVSGNGDTVAATGSQAMVWHLNAPARTVALPLGQKPAAIAVSPDGSVAVVVSTAEASDGSLITAYDVSTSQVRTAVSQSMPAWSQRRLAVPSATGLVLFETAYGTWERWRLPELKRTAAARVGFGVHNYSAAISPDGRFITYSNGDTELPLWRTDRLDPSVDRADAAAGSRGPLPTAIAVSRNNTMAATAANGKIYVSAIGAVGADHPLRELDGNAVVNRDALAFVDDGRRLVSASGPLVALWDISRLGRIETERQVRRTFTCGACPGPWLTVNEDRTAATLSDYGSEASIYSLTSDHAAALPALDAGYGPATWAATPTQLLITVPGEGGFRILDPAAAQPVLDTMKPHLYPAVGVKTIRMSADRRRIVLIDFANTVDMLDARDGHLIKKVNGPYDPEADEQTGMDANGIDPSGRFAGMTLYDGGAWLIDLTMGKAITVPGGTATGVALSQSQLAVQRPTGAVDLYALGSLHLLRTLPLDENALGPFALNTSGTLLAQTRSDGTIAIWNTSNGELLTRLTYLTDLRGLQTTLTFEGDDSTLAVEVEGENDTGRLQQWTLSPLQLVRAACRAADRDLSPDEWRRYAGTNPPKNLSCPR